MTVHSVQCGGTTHRIVLGPNSRIALLDHGNLSAELAAAEMGGDTPRCVEIVRKIRSGEWSKLPKWARDLRRPDREVRRVTERVTVQAPAGLRWLAQKWATEALPPFAQAMPWLGEVVIEFGPTPWARIYRPPRGGMETLYVSLETRSAYAALTAHLPVIPGRAVLSLTGAIVRYVRGECGAVYYPFSTTVGEWAQEARRRS